MVRGEVQEVVPVVVLHAVAAGAVVEPHGGVDDRLVQGWGAAVGEGGFPQQTVNLARLPGGFILAKRIGPTVLLAAGKVNRPGGDAREEHVLVHRQVVLVVHILSSVAAQPVGETGGHFGQGFAGLSTPQRRTAAARLRRDGQGESLILRGGPQGGFAHFGVPHQGHASRVAIGIRGQVVQRAGGTPRHRGDHAPLMRLRKTLARPVKQRVDAFGKSDFVVAHEVLLIHGGKAPAAAQDVAEGNPVPQAPRSVGRGVKSVPVGGVEGVEHEDGGGGVPAVGRDDHQLHLRLTPVVRKAHPDHFAGRGVLEEVAVGLVHRERAPQGTGRFRDGAVDQISEEPHDLRPADIEPLLRRGDAPTLGREQQRGQVVRGDLGFVIMHILVAVLGLVGPARQYREAGDQP